MPLWYMGANPSNSNDVVYNKYLTDLVSLSLTQQQITDTINARFALIPYALNSYVSTAVSTLATTSFVDEGNGNGTTTGKIRSLTSTEVTSGGRTDGPVTLDSSGKVRKDWIDVPSVQRWPQAIWSPSSYTTANGISTETTIATVPVNTTLTNYKVLVTGAINAKISVDGQLPFIQVRVGGPTGQVIASGYGVSESYPGGAAVSFTTAGAHSYLIPSWCTRLDLVALGGGGGGQGGGALNSNGEGGNAASWTTATVVRGTGIPSNATTLNITVGAGGNKGNGPTKGVGTSGGASSVVHSGTTLATSAGGTAGSSGAFGGDRTGQGPNPTTKTYNGQNYVGGNSVSSGLPGAAPGGGGFGGTGGFLGGTDGFPGASGAVWIYAYTDDDTNYGQINVIPKPLTAQTALTSSTTLHVTVSRSGTTGLVTTSTLNPQISVMVVPV